MLSFKNLIIKGRILYYFVPFSLIIIAACGFHPMHAQNEDSAKTASKLAAVEVKPIKSIVGQEYVIALKEVLDPSQSGTVPLYAFEASINRDTMPLAITQNRAVSRYKVVITVSYTLREIATGKILSKGSIKNDDDYDSVHSYYATYVSDNESAKRAARTLAQDTKIKIIAALIKN